MASRPLLPRHSSTPARAATSHPVGREHRPLETSSTPRALASVRWPGSSFKVEEVLPGSVYLWACGERDPGDSASPVSRPEIVAAWVVLMVLLVFFRLWTLDVLARRSQVQTVVDYHYLNDFLCRWLTVAAPNFLFVCLLPCQTEATT